jgi:hypothetical protein
MPVHIVSLRPGTVSLQSAKTYRVSSWQVRRRRWLTFKRFICFGFDSGSRGLILVRYTHLERCRRRSAIQVRFK